MPSASTAGEVLLDISITRDRRAAGSFSQQSANSHSGGGNQFS
ncbi:hypothetical protein ACFWOX_36610 [Streptomyces sp. NPDC058467]